MNSNVTGRWIREHRISGAWVEFDRFPNWWVKGRLTLRDVLGWWPAEEDIRIRFEKV